MRHEVAHVLQQEVARAVEVREGQVRHDHAVLHQAPVALVEAVHAGVALARRPAAQELHLARRRQARARALVQLGHLRVALRAALRARAPSACRSLACPQLCRM